MTLLLINIPLMVLFVALWVGIPTWLVLKHPDRKPEAAVAAPAVRTLTPAASRNDNVRYRRVA